MQKMYTPSRFAMIFAGVALFLSLYLYALYSLQVDQPWRGDGEEQVHTRVIRRTETIASARGNIYDRNGVLLASGRPSHNIMIEWNMVRANSVRANEDILNLIYAAMDADIQYTDTFPVTRGAPFDFVTNMTATQRNRLDTYFEFHGIDPDISAPDFLSWLRNHYNIDYTVGILDARLIIGVRYELEIRGIIWTITPYIFASDVSAEFVAYIEERGFQSVFSENTFVREYHTTAAPHIIGYVGPMTADEFEIFREYPWELPMNAIVGKMGAERAFENYLHGREGERVVQTSADGTILSVETTREPEPGAHVHLTIDLGLQIASENALRSQIETINAFRIANPQLDDYGELMDPEIIPGGAVVALDLNTGEILSAATYPTFNITTLSQDWAMLHTDLRNPMLNRAIHGQFIPGSSFKMVTALAALRNLDIGRWTPVNCTGRYARWEELDLVLHCAVFLTRGVGHGTLDIVQALEVSCNYFFFTVADRLPGGSAEARGDLLAETAMEFGLGIETGLQLPENPGRLATPDTVREIRGGYFAGDVLTTAFGQNENRFTPAQLANYAATIGNGGTLYALSILRRVVPSDFEGGPLFVHEPQILNVISETEYIEIIQEGMVRASIGGLGTARDSFRDFHTVVGSKTGTAQLEGRAVNDGIFVAYAPADNPQIAVAVVVEKGGSGAQVMDIARMIFDHFFATGGTFQVTPYGQMIP
ncbi:MAG: penicillin-binding transpeptidase domain-containing protein [Oscillospiraceae bacterium]|nr:penicillin-binding transpeptidase domain-containing protein [Oscillospiraceae bacterium]